MTNIERERERSSELVVGRRVFQSAPTLVGAQTRDALARELLTRGCLIFGVPRSCGTRLRVDFKLFVVGSLGRGGICEAA